MRRLREYFAQLQRTTFGQAAVLLTTATAIAFLGGAGQWLLRRPINVAATALIAMLLTLLPWVMRTWSGAHEGAVADFGQEPAIETTSSSEFSSYLLLRVQVRSSVGDAEQFARVLRPTIAELVDDQLLRRHGIVRSRRPDRAKAIVGDELWNILDEAGSPPALQVADLERLLDHIEQL